MSRAYRIRVRESVKRVIRAHDRVSTQLEVLEVLPPEQMAALLADELKRRGFEPDGDTLVRREKGVTIRVDPQSGTVTVEAESSQKVEVEAEREGWSYDEAGNNAKKVREDLRAKARQDLDRKADEKTADLQSQVTSRLEGTLTDLRQELDAVINRVTAEALKQKAAQLGQIKELTEDPETGSLTIVVEV